MPTDTPQMQLGIDADAIWRVCQAVRSKCPLIQCITNFVSMVSVGTSACSVSQAFGAATCVTTMFQKDLLAPHRTSWPTRCWLLVQVRQWWVLHARSKHLQQLFKLHYQASSAVGTLLRRSRSISTGGNRIGGKCWYAQSRLGCIHAACS